MKIWARLCRQQSDQVESERLMGRNGAPRRARLIIAPRRQKNNKKTLMCDRC